MQGGDSKGDVELMRGEDIEVVMEIEECVECEVSVEVNRRGHLRIEWESELQE